MVPHGRCGSGAGVCGGGSSEGAPQSSALQLQEHQQLLRSLCRCQLGSESPTLIPQNAIRGIHQYA